QADGRGAQREHARDQDERHVRLVDPARVHRQGGGSHSEATQAEQMGVPVQQQLHPVPHRATRSSSASRRASRKLRAASAPPAPSASTRALPTTTPSAWPAIALACAGVEIPKPTATGSVVARRTWAIDACSPSASDALAPVTPSRATR